MSKIIHIYVFIKTSIHQIMTDAYHGNTFALKLDPIWGTFLSLCSMGFLDLHWQITKFTGSIALTAITISMGVFGPALLRYWAHELGKKHKWIAKVMKHDKGSANE